MIFDDAALDQAVEGIVNGIYFNQGHVCCAGSPARAGVDLRAAIEKLKRRLTRSASATRSTRTPTSARSTRSCSSTRSPSSSRPARRRARRSTSRRAACRRRATGSSRPSSRTSRRATGSRRRRSSARCCRCSRSARPRRRSRRRTTRRTASARASGRRRARASSGWRSSCAPASSGRTPTTASTRRLLRRLQGVRLRPRGRQARPRAVPHLRLGGVRWLTASRSRRRTSSSSAARSRAASRPHVRGGGQNVARALAQGRARRRPRRARRLRQVVGADRLQPRAGPLPRRRDDGALSRRVRGPELGKEGGRPALIDRVVWYAGWADKLPQVLGGANPVAWSVLQFHRPRADRRRRRPRARRACARGADLAHRTRAGRGQRGHRAASETHPLAAIELAEVLATSDVPAGAVNILTGYREELGPWLAGHMDVNAIDVTGADGLSADLERLAADNEARRPRPSRGRPERVADRGLPRAQDGLAPDRALSATAGRRRQPGAPAFAAPRATSHVDPPINDQALTRTSGPVPASAFGTRLLLPPMSANPESSDARSLGNSRSSTRP